MRAALAPTILYFNLIAVNKSPLSSSSSDKMMIYMYVIKFLYPYLFLYATCTLIATIWIEQQKQQKGRKLLLI